MPHRLFPRTPNLQNPDTQALRAEICAYFLATFDTYEDLFNTLRNDEAYYQKPINLRHPLIFYLGHTATFFVNKLILARLIDTRINPRFESLFAVGVDEMGWDDLGVQRNNWPTVSEVKAYRRQVRELVKSIIEITDLQSPIHWQHPWWAILMGIEHERIHLETSSVLIRQQHIALVQQSERWQACKLSGTAPENRLISVPAGEVNLHKTNADAYYGWDNEFGEHHATVECFQASQYLVSNQEFLAFVEAGGYQTPDYWLPEGASWLDYSQAKMPTFWLQSDRSWQLRLMTDIIPMPWDWPVEVNYHEAKAFCNWKQTTTDLPIRLPSEDEWHRLYAVAGCAPVGAESAKANVHLDHFASACPVNHFAQGEFFDVTGNVWQWTETPIYPFANFEVHPLYDDFTTPTFDARHNLIKGGSFISCGNETLNTARYAFRRHFFQHAGFRYIASDKVQTVPSSHYETDKLLSEYAEFHYGDKYFNVPNFSVQLVQAALPIIANLPRAKALDLGCASGRASFELARHFAQVTGIDFSARFIGQGIQMIEEGNLRYTLQDEGELVSYKTRSLSDLGLDDIAEKVAFYQGDACNLGAQFTGYDFILAANLIDRLYKPTQFLEAIHERLNIGGILMLASPYTWLEEHTPREEWIGGFKHDGENVTTLDGLKGCLLAHFRLIQAPMEIPFVIRETKHKFQHSLSEVTFWVRLN